VIDEAAASDDPFALVVGQERAVEQLRAAATEPVHAYLFVGPRGSGKRRAAAALAGELVGDPVDRERTRRLAAAENHPDLVVVEPEGNTLRTEEAEAIVHAASRSPIEGGAKVILIDRFHDATAEAAAKLLKPIEEPPPSTRFILLAEEVPPEHITIASRSTRIDFPSVSTAAIVEALVARGVPHEAALVAAEGSGGDVGRAELLVSDEAFAERRNLWWSAPTRLDGSGHAVSEIVAELRSAIDEAQEPLETRHAAELEAMAEQEELTGTRGSGRKAMETRHKREARLHRTDEWRMGLATLALRYREPVVERREHVGVHEQLTGAADSLGRNPNEELWLTSLLWTLPSLPG
jgi:DNA polymerase-3 subunit delta'